MKSLKILFNAKHFGFLLVAVLTLLLAACTGAGNVANTGTAPESAGTPNAGAAGAEIEDSAGLVEVLKSTGASVDSAGEVRQDFIPVIGQVLRVNGADVQVFEFASEADREAVSSTISPDGSSIGTTMVSWIDQPNFFARGRLLVFYLGSDASILDLLRGVLGDAIAGG